MKILSKRTERDFVLKNYSHFFKTMIKAVVDIKKGIIALDAELHADLESMMLDEGSEQEDLWGINLFLKKKRKDWIDYTALINIRPSMKNRSMEIENSKIRRKIARIVYHLIIEP